jgi:hypothetical protein
MIFFCLYELKCRVACYWAVRWAFGSAGAVGLVGGFRCRKACRRYCLFLCMYLCHETLWCTGLVAPLNHHLEVKLPRRWALSCPGGGARLPGSLPKVRSFVNKWYGPGSVRNTLACGTAHITPACCSGVLSDVDERLKWRSSSDIPSCLSPVMVVMAQFQAESREHSAETPGRH